MTDDSLRIDKWLWQARFFKTRGIAAKLCNSGKVRIDGAKIDKSHYAVRIGHVLTFPQSRRIRVIRVVGLGTRRGPAKEAVMLYEDLSDAEPVPRIASLGRSPHLSVYSK
ncbi:MAG: RNA-binding S4 domain-containing protein [Rhodospirillaceae bacterium]|jgi:ribosome-associated heat shock protein Hsp15|nr:RNA-binding S4 domain-containing protein [Rhodospirillaceae bacterium]MBT5457911.1 RNA-binding S4 domain-containing protein [Rhodospirillaceae bacterium]